MRGFIFIVKTKSFNQNVNNSEKIYKLEFTNNTRNGTNIYAVIPTKYTSCVKKLIDANLADGLTIKHNSEFGKNYYSGDIDEIFSRIVRLNNYSQLQN